MAASGCQQNNTSKLGRLNLLHWQVVVLAPPYLQMLQHSNLVCKGTKANEALTGSSVPVSAVPVELTSTVMVTQETTKMWLSYFKTERCPAGELYGRAHLAGVFSIIPERQINSIRMSNRWPSNEAKPHNGIEAAFIPKGIQR